MKELEFNKNDDKMRLLISEMKQKYSKIILGGDTEIAKQHKKEN